MSITSIPEIIKEAVVYDDSLQIEKAQIRRGSDIFTRSRVNRPQASAVLVYNTETDTVVLTRQFRYAISAGSSEAIYEIMAGKVDEGEDPMDTATREAAEEIGYEITRAHLKRIASCYVSPGYTSELVNIFYAEVTRADKTQDGGGLKNEHEEIEIVELKSADFKKMVTQMQLKDCKTLLAGWWFVHFKVR
jgi:nudix-type nucleoside diphosphatase (YffH/AdpP family)